MKFATEQWRNLPEKYKAPLLQAVAKIRGLTPRDWTLVGAGAGLLVVGIGIGIVIGRAMIPPPPAPPQPIVQEQDAPQVHTGDDSNGPVLVEPPSPEPEPALPEPTHMAKPAEIQTATVAAARPAWRKFAVPVTVAADKPKIAIIIDDLGLDRRRTLRALDLPPPLTLAFLTYAEDLPAQTEAAHQHGHELLVHMPMQAVSSHFNAGPNTLEVGLSDQDLRARIDWGLGRFTGYVGVNNHMGSRFTADEPGMAIVMAEMKRRGLLFVDSVTTDVSQAGGAAKRLGVPFLQRQVFLDNEQTMDSIRHQLAETESIARRHGQAIAIGHPHDATLTALSEWLPTLAAKGFEIVPVTALLKEKKS